MTGNQIRYWEHKETGRHNLATEQETNRHNVETETETRRHNIVGEKETNRHNLATESADISKLAESVRHNKATEDITTAYNTASNAARLSELAEATRHNKASEAVQGANIALGYSQLAEQSRHNMAYEGEVYRHNYEMEGIDRVRNEITSALNESQIDLNQVRSVWEAVKGESGLRLTNSQIAKLDKEYRLLEQQYHNTDKYRAQENARDWLTTIGNLVRSAGSWR